MAGVGLAFLSASLNVLFERIVSREVLHFMQGRKPTQVLLRKLKNAMLSGKVVLEDAEEKQLTDSSVKEWVDELKDALYDAEDILDEIATEALQSSLQDAEPPTMGENLLNSISARLQLIFDKVDKKIEDVLDRLKDLVEQKDFMGLQVGVGEKQADPEIRQTTSYVSESETFGRDEDKKKVIDILIPSDAGDNEMSCVIAIVGMGGIGKTTLAQLVYNDSKVERHFNVLKIWFCVSEEFDMPKLEKSIIEAADLLPCPNFENPEQLQVTLKKKLNGKKFLLVLDDVWSEKPIHREFLGQLLHYGSRGSKILVTTRHDSVALAMKAIATHHPKLLPKDDCWSLFEKHAFRDGSSNADPKIKDIGRQIVDKCKGLPLAIKAIGDLLWSERPDVERWTKILKSNVWDLPMEGEGANIILPALRLSYKYLPSYLKPCFAYCSIFPKDYSFEKDQLVLLWMAEGFLRESKQETMEEVGNRYFDALVSRSFFQQSIICETYNSGFVMHDLVNDLANFVTGQFGTDSFKKIVKMTRYVSYSSEHWREFEYFENDLLKAKHLRTFLPIGLSPMNFGKIKRILRTILCLRVLSLDMIPQGSAVMLKLPDSVVEMKYLRYLDVSGAKFDSLPDSICDLCNLQTLKLSRCHYLKRLPRDMWKLINLRHLKIDQTNRLKEMPMKMGSLNCLQTLSKFIVSKHDDSGSSIGELGKLINLRGELLIDDSESSIGELGKLINLRGELLIEELQNVKSAKDASNASLKDKDYLEKLVLQWNDILESQRDVLENLQPHEVLENLRPHENLKSLFIKCYDGNGFPKWLGGLISLSELKLIDCKYCMALPPLGHLPYLNTLYIEGLHGVDTVGPNFYGNSSNSSMKPFGSLKFLRLENMSNWKNWFHLGAENEVVETFSQLEELYIVFCPKLRGKLPVNLHSLAKLEIRNCQHLEDTLGLLALPEQQINDGITYFNYCLQELRISDCKKLELPMHRKCSSLEVLLLTNCCDSLTSISLDLFPNLKYIRIDGCNNLNSLKQHGTDHLVISSIAIRKCPKFVDFPKRGFLPSLCYLALRDCPEVESFPEGGLPSNLKHIAIENCKKLIENRKGWGFQTLPSLEWLEIRGGESEDYVVSFPGELLLPTTLTHLHIYSFGKLESLDKEGFQHLTSLVQLMIHECPELRCMPEEGFPASLRLLWMQSICPRLEEELKIKEGEEWLKVASVPNIVTAQSFQGDDGRPDWRSPYKPVDH